MSGGCEGGKGKRGVKREGGKGKEKMGGDRR